MGDDKLSLHLGECLVFDENIGRFPSDTTHCALLNVKSICPTTVETKHTVVMGADKLSLHLGECLVFDENIGHFPSDTTHCALVNVKSTCHTTGLNTSSAHTINPAQTTGVRLYIWEVQPG